MADVYSHIVGAGEKIADLTLAQYDTVLVHADYNDADTADLTISVADVKIVFQPGVVYTQDITIDTVGDNTKVIVMPGASIQNVTVTTGSGNYLRVYNGGTVGTVSHTTAGSKTMLHGDAWGAFATELNASRDDCFTEYMRYNNVSPTPTANHAIDVPVNDTARTQIRFCNIVDADVSGVRLLGIDSVVFGNIFQGADNTGISFNRARNQAVANIVITADQNGIFCGANADNCVIGANYISDGAANPLSVDSGSQNCIWAANILSQQDTPIGGLNTTGVDNHFVPASSQIALWLDAADAKDAGAATPDNGEDVATWADQINSTSFSMAGLTSSNNPDYVTSAQNGRPGVDFDVSNTEMIAATADLPTASAGYIFIAWKRTATSTGFQTLYASSDKSLGTFIVAAYASYGTSLQDAISVYGVGADVGGINEAQVTGAQITGFGSTGSAYEIRQNGDSKTLDFQVGSDTGDWFDDVGAGRDIQTVGGLFAASTEQQHGNATIMELIRTDGTPTQFEIDSIENYLSTKFDIALV